MSLTGVDAGEVAAPPPPEPVAGSEPSLVDLARNSTRFAQAWGDLVAGEAALARVNLGRMLLVALFIPALAVGVVAGLDGVLAGMLHHVIADWTVAIGGVAAINLALLFVVLYVLRRWWRTLSLPRSREALTRLWRDHDDKRTDGKNPDAQGHV
jgi:hypothetical protein